MRYVTGTYGLAILGGFITLSLALGMARGDEVPMKVDDINPPIVVTTDRSLPLSADSATGGFLYQRAPVIGTIASGETLTVCKKVDVSNVLSFETQRWLYVKRWESVPAPAVAGWIYAGNLGQASCCSLKTVARPGPKC